MDLVSIITAASILGSLGLLFGALIALAHRRFQVWVDPRIEGARERLPGTNCGACGFPGCDGFAEGVVRGETDPAGCTVMGPEETASLAEFLGVAAGEANRRVARLLCAGGCDVAPRVADYRGLQSCVAAAAVAGGGKACTWGCLGLGDCAEVCDFDAITMGATQLPEVDPELCTACNDCVEVCPKDLFTLMPVTQRLLVQCRSALEGEDAEALCQVACNGCGRCALDGAPNLITIENGLAVIDYTRNDSATTDAIVRCPTGAIVWVDGAQFAPSMERAGRTDP